jgi:gluconokinase
MGLKGCVVGLDMGTTSLKALAFDASGREVGRGGVALETWHDDDGAAEQDAEHVFQAAMTALTQAADQARAAGFAVERIGISGAMHSMLPVGDDGTPLGRAMLWMDTRARDDAVALWATPVGKALYARTGTPIHAMSPLVKLHWARAHLPQRFGPNTRVASLKEYVWHRMHGVWEVDASIASATGLYALAAGTWDAEALAYADVRASQLSALVPTTFTRRVAAGSPLVQAGIPAGATTNIGASDGVLANLGVGIIGNEALVLTIGTSLAARTGSPRIVTDEATRSFCYVLDDNRYIVGGPSNSGGVVLEWLYRQVLAGSDAALGGAASEQGFATILEAAGACRDEHLLCVPYLSGERAPVWDSSARGVFWGLTLRHTAANLMRAAVEGIIFNAHWIGSRLREQQGTVREIIASGKVLETAWVRQLVADLSGLPVRYLGAVDASARGAAALADIAVGAATWDGTVHQVRDAVAQKALPGDGAAYARQYARYRRLVALEEAGLDAGGA